MGKNHKKFILTGQAGLSGLLLALAYPGWSLNFSNGLITGLGFLVWIGFIPLFCAMGSVKSRQDTQNIGTHPRSRSYFFIGFLAGFVYFLILFRWLWSTFPLTTIGIENNFVSFAIVLFIYILSSAGMGVFWGLFAMAFRYWILPSKPSRGYWRHSIISGLVTAAIFGLAEFWRAFGFSLLWLGSGTILGSNWTLGSPAYTLYENFLALKLSSYVGIYGVGFLIIFINFLLFKFLSWEKIKKSTKIEAMVLIVALFSLIPNLFNAPPELKLSDKKIKFAAIQTRQSTQVSYSSKEALGEFKEQLELFNRVAKDYPESQLIIFPEAGDFLKNLSMFVSSNEIGKYFADIFKEPKMIIAGERIVGSDGRAYSRAFSIDTGKDVIGFYDKQLLTPGGEFLPYSIRLPASLISKKSISEFGDIRELSVGNKKSSLVNFRDQFIVAPIICSEVLAPDLVRTTTQGSDIIVELTSYGFFRGNETIVKQNLAAASFRAAENQKPLIVASNMGLSYVINSNGNVLFITANSAPQILTGYIDLNGRESWYNKAGDLPTILAFLLLFLVFVRIKYFRRKGEALE